MLRTNFARSRERMSALAAEQATGTALFRGVAGPVKDERWGWSRSIRGLPIGVRDGMQTCCHGQLDIAEPEARFSCRRRLHPKLPIRRWSRRVLDRSLHCLYERADAQRALPVHWKRPRPIRVVGMRRGAWRQSTRRSGAREGRRPGRFGKHRRRDHGRI